MSGRDLGRAVTLLSRFVGGWDLDDEYSEAMGAPLDELGPIISRGRAKTLRLLKRRVKAMTGLKWPAFKRELTRRTSARWVHFHSPLTYLAQYEQVGRRR